MNLLTQLADLYPITKGLTLFVGVWAMASCAACTSSFGALGGIEIQRDYSARLIALQETEKVKR